MRFLIFKFILHFLLQTLRSVCRIGEVLLHLQQVGNVRYTGWRLQIPCSSDSGIVGVLQRMAKEMEDELEKWKGIVKRTREKYYELNYYTTLQLLTLREKLGAIKNSERCVKVTPDVLALLQSISSKVSADAVSLAIKNLSEEGVKESQNLEINTTFAESVSSDKVTQPATTLASPPIALVNPLDSFKPNLAEGDLSDEQRSIMADIISKLYCSKYLVLRAFEVCSQEQNDKYVYYGWCENNLSKDHFDDDEADTDGEESSESDAGRESSEKEFCNSPGMTLSPSVSIVNEKYPIVINNSAMNL